MRILCTMHPGTGHLHPIVPLARALEAAGHEFAVATAASFNATVEAAGLDAFPAGPDWLLAEPDGLMPGFLDAEGPAQMVMLAQLATRGVVDDLVAIAEHWRPDVILRDSTEYAGWVAAERLGIPHAAYALGLRLPGSFMRMWTGDLLADLPRVHGLAPDPDLSRMVDYLYLNFLPESFEMPPADILRSVVKSYSAVDGVTPLAFARAIGKVARAPKTLAVSQRLRPPVFDQSGPEELPAWMHELPAQPTVYASLGTVFNRTPAVLDAIVAALRDEPLNLILTVGRNGDPDRFGPQPPSVRIERYIPQSQLLPHCDVVLTHGGYNTTMAALSHGLPVCCLPLSADQPIMAHRVVSLGAGLSCANASPSSSPFARVDPATLTPAGIRTAVRRLLAEPRFRVAAEGLRREMLALPDVETAVGSLERLAATRAPVLAPPMPALLSADR
jgi:UDP:flavonoid glycosyltransferase YjiC (YdhE family)